MTWDTATPVGTEAISNGDDRIRELKTDLQTALRGNTTDGLEAKFPGSDTANPVFRYRGLKGATGSRPAAGQYGLYFDTTRNVLQRDNGSSWEDIATMFPAATAMVFYQVSAPTGWTKQTTINDRCLRVVSGSTGGSTGGSQGIGNSLTHTHTVASHNHDLGSHTHTTPAHQHTLEHTATTRGTQDGSGGALTTDLVFSARSEGANIAAGINGAPPNTDVWEMNNRTESSGSGTSGAASGNTGNTALTSDAGLDVILAYADVIICTKD